MKPSQQVRELAATAPGATTDELLHNLLANLTGLLGARRAYVTEVANGTAKSVASWEDNRRGPVLFATAAGTGGVESMLRKR